MIDARVLVVGGGAIGGVVAAKMTGRVTGVTVLDADVRHAALMRDPGLRVDDLGEERCVSLEAHSDPGELEGPFDLALMTVKAAFLGDALRPLHDRGLAASYVSLGNGLVQDLIASIVGLDGLLVGTVEWGATNLGPGRVAQTTRAPFVLGELDGKVRERTRLAAAALEAAAEVRITANIQGQVWSKLLVNSAWSGLGAVSGLLYREVAAHPAGREAALGLWREGVRVAEAQRLELEGVLGIHPRDLVEGTRAEVDEALDVYIGHAGAVKASMLQDLERGVPCEVDFINGGVARRGEGVGIPTPLNRRVVDIVHAIERGERRPSPEALQDVLEGRTA
ncbi:MAG: ketopantoate reductase family protein [Actinomycetota bacterium]